MKALKAVLHLILDVTAQPVENPVHVLLLPHQEVPARPGLETFGVLLQPLGRALTAKEVRYLLSGPDREKPEGARDYALTLTMLRLSLRVSEVCSLRASSVKWSHGR